MSKRSLTFICQNCGARRRRAGRASARPAASGTRWSRKAPQRPPGPGRRRRARAACSRSSRWPARPRRRRGCASGIAEFDRVTGGGFVRGSVLLMAGDPGIGKSTLLIQAAAAMARAGHRAVYISGEEAVAQVRLRAERLGLARRRGRACGRNLGRGHHRHAVGRQDAAPGRHRFHPDHVDRHGRIARPAPSRRCAARRRR